MDQKIIPFVKFEQIVMKKLLEQDTILNKMIMTQYENAQIESREFTGVGFFTNFIIPENVPRITELVSYGYGSADCRINDIDGYGFILFIEDGILLCLEGYACIDFWPKIINNFEFI